VTEMKAGYFHLKLVNTNQIESRTVLVQGGAYGEHEICHVVVGGNTYAIGDRFFTVRMAPGAGAELEVHDKRYANQPTMAMPWFGGISPERWVP